MYLTHEPIDLAAFLAEARPSDGAACLFVGVVRNESEGKETVAIEYQAYEEMAELELAHVVASVSHEWPGAFVRICHRVGRLSVGEPSVAILVTAPGIRPDLEEGNPSGRERPVGGTEESVAAVEADAAV